MRVISWIFKKMKLFFFCCCYCCWCWLVDGDFDIETLGVSSNFVSRVIHSLWLGPSPFINSSRLSTHTVLVVCAICLYIYIWTRSQQTWNRLISQHNTTRTIPLYRSKRVCCSYAAFINQTACTRGRFFVWSSTTYTIIYDHNIGVGEYGYICGVFGSLRQRCGQLDRFYLFVRLCAKK